VSGPGAWHFHPRAEWLRLAATANLRQVGEPRIAHLVTAFAFERPSAPQSPGRPRDRTDQPADLSGTTLLTRQVSYAHLFFIGLTCVLLGALPLASAGDLLSGGPLPTAILCGQTLFWGNRWLMQFTYFSSSLWRGHPLRTAAHLALAGLWTWVTAVFALALAHAVAAA
jgi:hypothetical protein